MIEWLLCLPVMLLLLSLLVEASRLMALLIVLDVATQAAAEDLSLRLILLEKGGLITNGTGNAPDLSPALHEKMRDSILSYVGSFPGYVPFSGSGEKNPPPSGAFHVDLEKGNIEVRFRMCVPPYFLPWSHKGQQDPADDLGRRNRDCTGKFVRWEGGPQLILESTSIVPIPASHEIYRNGLAFPDPMPLVNDPQDATPFVGTRPWGPAWDSLFADVAALHAQEPAGAGQRGASR
jgi:hypothetical protein